MLIWGEGTSPCAAPQLLDITNTWGAYFYEKISFRNN